MIKIGKNNFITILDLGTSKTALFIVRLDKNDSFSIVSSSLVNTRGMQRGLITDLGAVTDTIAEAVKIAEEKAKIRISSLFTNISAPDLRGQKIKASVPVSDKPSQITLKDLERVKLAARHIAVPYDREVVHMIAQSYAVDGQDDLKNPLGLAGTHLEGNFYLITASLSSVQNIMRAVNNVGLNISGLAFSGWVVSENILSEEEKNDGVILLEIGGGTTKIVVLAKGQLKAVELLPLGGDDLSEALSNELRIPLKTADELKKRYASRLLDSSSEDKIMLNQEDKFRSVSRKQFNQVLNKAWSDILEKVLERVKKIVSLNQITSGVVVCGGCVLMDNSLEKIESAFSLPVRLGLVKDVPDQDSSRAHNPIYTTSYSLIQYAIENYHLTPSALPTPKNLWGKVISQAKEVLQDYF